MAEVDVIALKEALNNPTQSIQELFAELEEERKAAASGFDEALSMISRLQNERAMVKMKASQYERMTELKMRHTEESLAFLRETLLEKEIEIATLKFQVGPYRQNMLIVGLSNTDVVETKMFETPRLNYIFRRQMSMPCFSIDSLNLDLDNIEKNEPLFPTIHSRWNETGECSKQLRKQRSAFFPNKSIIEEVSSYSESQEAKEDLSLKLSNEERIISSSVEANDESQPNVRTDPSCVASDSRKGDNIFKTKLGSKQIISKCSYCSSLSSQRQRPELDSLSCSYQEKDSNTETVHSNIEDIYEIPNNNYGGGSLEAKQKAVEGSLDDDLLNQPPMKYPIMGKGVSMNSLQACEIQSDVEELKQRVQKLENDQWIMKEEESKRNNEHLKLNIIQSQTKVSKCKQLMRASDHEKFMREEARDRLLRLDHFIFDYVDVFIYSCCYFYLLWLFFRFYPHLRV